MEIKYNSGIIQDNARDLFQKRGLIRHSNLYIYYDLLPEDKIVSIDQTDVKLKKQTKLVFADLAPWLNWAHPCEYLLYDAGTDQLYQTIPAHLPPKGFLRPRAGLTSEYHQFNQALPPSTVAKKLIGKETERSDRTAATPEKTARVTEAPQAFAGQRYAILFSGLSERRHLNDLEFMYRALIDKYRFDPNNIWVLNFDGSPGCYVPSGQMGGPQPSPYPGGVYRMQVRGAGHRSMLKNKLGSTEPMPQSNPLSGITENDLLFVFTTNHGGNYSTGSPVGPCIICEDEDLGGDGFTKYDMMGVGEFADAIARLTSKTPIAALIVVMEQCFSGAFAEAVIASSKAKKTFFAASTRPCSTSNGCATLSFDQFAYNFTTALAGHTPEGAPIPPDNPGVSDPPSMIEAFMYAADHCTPNGGDGTYYIDTPNYAENPAGCGRQLYLM